MCPDNEHCATELGILVFRNLGENLERPIEIAGRDQRCRERYSCRRVVRIRLDALLEVLDGTRDVAETELGPPQHHQHRWIVER